MFPPIPLPGPFTTVFFIYSQKGGARKRTRENSISPPVIQSERRKKVNSTGPGTAEN